MDYNHITNFFGAIKKLVFVNEEAHGVIKSVIIKHISFPIDTASIKIKGTTIHIQGSPMLGSEILIHKQGILTDLSNLLPQRHFTDITK